MKSKNFLVFLIALFALVLTLNTVMAFATIDEVKVDNIDISSETVAVKASETIPVEVKFTATDDGDGIIEDVSDVKVKVFIEGYKDDISASSDRFRVVEGRTYVKRFTLKLPSDMDLDADPEVLSLSVRISAKGESTIEGDYPNISIQKDSYSLNILSVETDEKAMFGDTVAVDVVLQNNGAERLDNVYAKVSIPELGIEKKVYFGDVSSIAEDDNNDIKDAVEKRVYLTIPRNAIPGSYNIQVEAYNYDSSVTAKKAIVISGVATNVLPSVDSKLVSAGEETAFNVVLVNTNNRMIAYSITPEESKGLLIEVTEPIVTVPADSSKNVQVKVKATKNAEEGTHLITLNVYSESGLVRQIGLAVNVENKQQSTSEAIKENNPVWILTVVLAVVFVILLIVLIVLLTRKPTENEELGETSYY